ncbi:hypothetical protein Dimus_031616 [Dionaea muscipula]
MELVLTPQTETQKKIAPKVLRIEVTEDQSLQQQTKEPYTEAIAEQIGEDTVLPTPFPKAGKESGTQTSTEPTGEMLPTPVSVAEKEKILPTEEAETRTVPAGNESMTIAADSLVATEIE